MRVHVQVLEKDFRFTSEMARALFFQKNFKKYAYIEIDDATSSEKRRYFEGCLVPVVFYTHPNSGWKSLKEAREALKMEFTGTEQRDLDGNIVRVAKSTTELNNAQFGRMLDAVVRWLLENQLCGEDDIDPENYKAWRDSAPGPGEVYPPLARMKARYAELSPAKKTK